MAFKFILKIASLQVYYPVGKVIVRSLSIFFMVNETNAGSACCSAYDKVVSVFFLLNSFSQWFNI